MEISMLLPLVQAIEAQGNGQMSAQTPVLVSFRRTQQDHRAGRLQHGRL